MPSAADRARAALVDDLVARGRVRSTAVAAALRAVPRHLFLPGVPLADAYADDAVAVQHVDGVPTSSASQPAMVAIMLEQLDLRPGLRVLEIGAGTGWNAALLAHLVAPGGRVVSLDIDADLVDTARTHLAAAGVDGVELVVGDGALGHPDGAPYDRIVLTVGSDDVRPEWTAQLAPGGRLLLPLDLRGAQVSVALDLDPDGALRSRSLHGCGFIRLRGAAAGPGGTELPLPGGARLLLPADAPPVDPAPLAAALAHRGTPVPAPVALGAADLRDGFGLWLTLTEPGAGRLVTGPGHADLHLALVGDDGLATVTPAAGPTTVVPAGPGGDMIAGRLLAALRDWGAAGRPGTAGWTLVVRPGHPPDGAGPRAIALPHAWVACAPRERSPDPGTLRAGRQRSPE